MGMALNEIPNSQTCFFFNLAHSFKQKFGSLLCSQNGALSLAGYTFKSIYPAVAFTQVLKNPCEVHRLVLIFHT